LAGATIFTVGVGAGGSGLADPCDSVIGGAGGVDALVAGAGVDEVAGAAAADATGGAGGGGGGGGRLSFAPPHAIATTAGRIGIVRKS
jgi:hypothetical protein